MNVDEIRTITIRTLTEGMDKAVSDLNNLSNAQSGLAVESDKSSKASTSVKNALDGQQRTLDTAYRAQNQFNKSQLDITRGYNEGMISLDRYNQLSALNSQRLKDATTSHSLLEKAMSGVQGQLVALAGGAGPVGVFLAGLGPWGLAAAAGLGAAKYVFDGLANAATAVGEKAVALNAFSIVTGMTTDQLQKLEEEGMKFGLTTENVSRFVDQFSVKLVEATKASGAYYIMAKAINPVLAENILTTKGEAAQLQILAQLYAQAGEKANALLQAASGRGGVVNAPLIGALAAVGGDVNNLSGLPGLSTAEIDRIKTITAEINTTMEHVKTNIGSILWNTTFKESSASMAHDMEAMSNVLRNFSPSSEWTDFTNWVDRQSGGILSKIFGTGKLPGQTESGGVAVPVIPVTGGGPLPTAEVTQAGAQATANEYKAMVSALGSAASATQHLIDKQLTLFAQFKSGAIDKATYEKAIGGALTDNLTQSINATVGALGMMATTTEIATQSQLRINKAILDGGKISGDQAILIKEADQLKFAATKQNTDASFGLASATEMLNLKTAEFINTAKQRNYTDQQTADGLLVVARNSKTAYEASQVAASAHPQLTRLAFDSVDLNKQFDTLAVSGVGHLADSIVSLNSGTVKMGDAFKALGVTVINEIEKMIIQMTIFNSLKAMGFGGSGGAGGGLLGLLGLGGSSGGTSQVGATWASGNVGMMGGVPFPIAHSGGVLGSDTMASRYIHPAYFDDAPGFGSGGIVGGEVPVIAHKGEGVFTPGQMAAMGGGNAPVIHIYPVAGSTMDSMTNSDGSIELVGRMIDAKIGTFGKTLPDRVAAINRDPRKR